MDGRKESKGESEAECIYGVDLFIEDHHGEEWSRCKKCLKRGTLFLLTIRNGRLRETSARNKRQLFIVVAKC